jgi:hypothetical protein
LLGESVLQELGHLNPSANLTSYFDKNDLDNMTPEETARLYRILTANRYGIYSEPGFQMKEFAAKCMEMADSLTPKIKDLVLLYAKDISETYEQRNFMFSSLVTRTEYI